MKKDIDLLSGFNEAKGKKSSSNTSLIVVILIIAIIGVLVYMFVSAKMQVSEKEEILGNLDIQLQDSNRVSIMENDIALNKSRYQNLVSEMIKEVYSGQVSASSAEISSKFLEIIYDDYALLEDEEGNVKVKIEKLAISSVSNVTMNCKFRSKESALEFYNYLKGTLVLERPDLSASLNEKAEYEARQEAIYRNAKYFKGVKYPGLPNEGSGNSYDVSMNFNFDIDWEAMAKDEIK